MTTYFMENPYSVQVNENLNFPLSKEDIASLDIYRTGERTFHLLKNGVSYHVEVVDADFNTRAYTIKVNGSEYQAAIHTPLDELIKKMGFASNGSKNINSVSAPMPGLILDIAVQEGQEVKEDEQLVILEAMKMENIISSPRNGVIKKIAVKKGDAVDKKQVLVEFQ